MTKKGVFETKLSRLEKIVEQLESESSGLESSTKLFEEGVAISKELSKELKEVKFRIETLKKDAQGELSTEPFEEDSGDEETAA